MQDHGSDAIVKTEFKSILRNSVLATYQQLDQLSECNI